MLALATRNAMPQAERVVLELGEIEDEARLAKLMVETSPPAPTSLADARNFFVAAQQSVLDRQAMFDLAAAAVVAVQRSRPWWRRAVGFITGYNARHSADIRAASLAKDRAQLVLKHAVNDRLSEENRLNVAIALQKDAVREHVATWTKRAADADARIAAVKAANEMWKHLPGVSAVGAAGLYQLGVKMSGRKRPRRHAPRGSGESDFSVRP